MERELIACAVASRQDYELILNYIKVKSKDYSKEFQAILDRIGSYYERDKEAHAVSSSILKEQIAESLRSEKLASRLTGFVDEAVATTASLPNVKDLILSVKRQEVADRLSAALVEGEHGTKVQTLLEQYKALAEQTSLDEEEEQGDVLVEVDVTSLIQQAYDPTNVIELLPKSLNDRLDGGAKKGHHVVLFGPTNIGKTALAVTVGAGVARQGKRAMHLINEEPASDVYLRYVSCLSGMDKHSIRDNPAEAQARAKANGLDNVVVVNIKPGTPDIIKHYIGKYTPDAIIVDQLRNLIVNAENRTNQLERAATSMRNIAKQCNVLVVSITQAGDSARDKLILDGGDVDSSNVGIPAQADLLVGVGTNQDHDERGLRVMSLIKNKIGAVEDHFPVRIVKTLSRYTSV